MKGKTLFHKEQVLSMFEYYYFVRFSDSLKEEKQLMLEEHMFARK